MPEETTVVITETTDIESAIESALSTEPIEETTTMTTAISYLPVDEQLTYIRSDLDYILGLAVAFLIIEMCKWSYRLLNIFMPI